MKLLFVIDSLGRGGKERRMLELIKGFKQREQSYEIYLISLSNIVDYKYVYDLPIHFEIIERKFKRDPRIIFKLKKIVESFKPDIIHSWGTMASVYLSIVSLFSKRPLICSVIADAFPNLSIMDSAFLRVKFVSFFSDAIVANSQAGIASYRPPLHKTHCIYNGIDFNRFLNLTSPDLLELELFGAPKGDRIVLGMVANFSPWKDYDTMVQVAINLCRDNRKLIFLFVGSGSTLERLKFKVDQEKLNEQIIFAGKRDDIESIIQIFDIGMLITFTEGISNSILEYMAMGKAVIATEGGGTAELVINDFNGFLVEKKNEEQIIEKIKILIRDKNEREGMGNKGYHWVRENFDLNHKTEEYKNLYSSVIANKSSDKKQK